jgi:oligopeptide/dipeptide ABC transporter ATP-binding protein
MTFRGEGSEVRVLDDLDLDVREGEFVCILGPSGCGKSTLLNIVAGFLPPTSGSVRIDGEEVHGPDPRRIFVFQERGVFPWLTVEGNIGFGLGRLSREEREKRIGHDVRLVGLEGFEKAYPHELSGGMKQRACIAIAISLRPKVIIADEPTSALDVVVQRQVMVTLARVQRDLGAAVILIGHDIGLMAQFVDRLAVMYAGRLVEMAPIAEIITNPRHPYTRALIATLPSLERRGALVGIPGLAPLLRELPLGCAFHPRCPQATDRCRIERPVAREIAGARVACHLA